PPATLAAARRPGCTAGAAGRAAGAGRGSASAGPLGKAATRRSASPSGARTASLPPADQALVTSSASGATQCGRPGTRRTSSGYRPAADLLTSGVALAEEDHAADDRDCRVAAEHREPGPGREHR